MKKVFISGCYDILEAGHIQFFKEAGPSNLTSPFDSGFSFTEPQAGSISN